MVVGLSPYILGLCTLYRYGTPAADQHVVAYPVWVMIMDMVCGYGI